MRLSSVVKTRVSQSNSVQVSRYTVSITKLVSSSEASSRAVNSGVFGLVMGMVVLRHQMIGMRFELERRPTGEPAASAKRTRGAVAGTSGARRPEVAPESAAEAARRGRR